MDLSSQTGRRDEDAVDFKYEGTAPQPDLLSYKDMMLQMSRSAPTNTGWMSVAVVVGFTLCGIAGFSMLCNALFR
jgi:hypothetical protein